MALSPQLLTRLLPLAKRHGPTVVRFVTDPKNREAATRYAQGLADKSPGRRLAAHIDLTGELAASMAEQATTPADAERARAWQKRAAAMRYRLALPVVKDKKRHRAELEADLIALHDEMSAVLTADEPGRSG